ncbi:MAG: hypothetical protein ABI454_02330 [Sphingomicrobium sp.]
MISAFILTLEIEMFANILRADWIRVVLPLVLTVGIVGAGLAFAISAG